MSIEVAQMDAVGRLGVAIKRIERLRSALERSRTVLSNMALENEPHQTMGFLFVRRWPISDEPLRADARGLLPVIDAALSDAE